MTNTLSEERSLLHAKLLGETAAIGWEELQPFFARGVILRVSSSLDLVDVATAMSLDEKDAVGAWLSAGQVNRLEPEQAQDWLARDPDLWTVVVAPWVLVQERGAKPAMN